MKEYNEHHKGTGDGEAEFIEILKKLIRPLFWRGPTIVARVAEVEVQLKDSHGAAIISNRNFSITSQPHNIEDESSGGGVY